MEKFVRRLNLSTSRLKAGSSSPLVSTSANKNKTDPIPTTLEDIEVRFNYHNAQIDMILLRMKRFKEDYERNEILLIRMQSEYGWDYEAGRLNDDMKTICRWLNELDDLRNGHKKQAQLYKILIDKKLAEMPAGSFPQQLDTASEKSRNNSAETIVDENPTQGWGLHTPTTRVPAPANTDPGSFVAESDQSISRKPLDRSPPQPAELDAQNDKFETSSTPGLTPGSFSRMFRPNLDHSLRKAASNANIKEAAASNTNRSTIEGHGISSSSGGPNNPAVSTYRGISTPTPRSTIHAMARGMRHATLDEGEDTKKVLRVVNADPPPNSVPKKVRIQLPPRSTHGLQESSIQQRLDQSEKQQDGLALERTTSQGSGRPRVPLSPDDQILPEISQVYHEGNVAELVDAIAQTKSIRARTKSVSGESPGQLPEQGISFMGGGTQNVAEEGEQDDASESAEETPSKLDKGKGRMLEERL